MKKKSTSIPPNKTLIYIALRKENMENMSKKKKKERNPDRIFFNELLRPLTKNRPSQRSQFVILGVSSSGYNGFGLKMKVAVLGHGLEVDPHSLQ